MRTFFTKLLHLTVAPLLLIAVISLFLFMEGSRTLFKSKSDSVNLLSGGGGDTPLRRAT